MVKKLRATIFMIMAVCAGSAWAMDSTRIVQKESVNDSLLVAPVDDEVINPIDTI